MPVSEGAVRKRTVPVGLRGKRIKNSDIITWAREQLSGEEPDIGQEVLKGIKDGIITEVLLRPKRPGFFAPDGTFVEAYHFAPGFGEDLAEAESKWEDEEHDRRWVDEENARFNKTTVERSPRIGAALWEHGRRIETYSKERNRSTSGLLHLLDQRKKADGYARHTHQTSIDFFRWLPDLGEADPILDWKWERIDAVLRFSNDKSIRAHLRTVIEATEVGNMRDDELSRLLGIKERRPDSLLQADERSLLVQLRSALKKLEHPTRELIGRVIAIIERGHLEEAREERRDDS